MRYSNDLSNAVELRVEGKATFNSHLGFPILGATLSDVMALAKTLLIRLPYVKFVCNTIYSAEERRDC